MVIEIDNKAFKEISKVLARKDEVLKAIQRGLLENVKLKQKLKERDNAIEELKAEISALEKDVGIYLFPDNPDSLIKYSEIYKNCMEESRKQFAEIKELKSQLADKKAEAKELRDILRDCEEEKKMFAVRQLDSVLNLVNDGCVFFKKSTLCEGINRMKRDLVGGAK